MTSLTPITGPRLELGYSPIINSREDDGITVATVQGQAIPGTINSGSIRPSRATVFAAALRICWCQQVAGDDAR